LYKDILYNDIQIPGVLQLMGHHQFSICLRIYLFE